MFKTAKMGDRYLARLVELAKGCWGDEWWTIGQVARYHHIDIRSVDARFSRGTLEGIRWGNWYIRKSVATGLTFYRGKGGAVRTEWSARADEFILKCHGEGLNCGDIGRLMKWPAQRVSYRLRLLIS